MWRLKRSSSREVLRLGRLAVERWADGVEGLRLVDSKPLAAAESVDHLPNVIEALFATVPAARVTVVLESAWVPVMLAEIGSTIWRRPEVEALLRHRLASLHDDPSDPVSEWDVRIDHRAGETRALGYGFSPRLHEALREASRAAGREWSALMPAWSWGWQRSRPQRQWRGSDGHWAWQEQDRTLLGSFRGKRLVALNSACKPCRDGAALAEALVAHSVRHGLQGVAWPMASAGWQGPA